ncbi:hypothetical protein PHLGIDRAFT_138025 [Phlebiopsis gigantea 11061_1 CR5-6]|uniref:Uncharacterized protein n=1 Tax=Phlebiopsis gigantea (strain 11061_1 CR5-6) TaxID=745531 RepID=A0A0C3SFX9_PHLG1|nr:hypothetical protein PHLGIDRAFT_138025 [Phlebiopsis gigantea 11061_1 CR5-6]
MRPTLLFALGSACLAQATPPVVPRQSASNPLGCIWWCYLNGTETNSAGQVVNQLTDSPGCSDCPGSACTGKLHGELHLGTNMFVGDYWVRTSFRSLVRPVVR